MSDVLQELIGSMSGPEKRYFKKLITAFKRDSEHLRLFSFMTKNRSLKKDPLGVFEGGYKGNEAALRRRYLKEQIMLSLRNFHRRSSRISIITDLILDAEIFYRKKLFQQCLKSLQRAKKMAIQLERFGLQLEIIDWERRLIGSTLEYLPISEDQIAREQAEIQVKNENLNRTRRLQAAVFEYKKKQGFVDEGAKTSLYKILPPDDIEDPKDMKSNRARFYYLWTLTIYYSMLGDHEKSFQYAGQIDESYERIVDEEDLVYGMLEFLTACIYTHRYAEVLSYLQKMEVMVSKSPYVDLVAVNERMFYYKTNYTMIAYAGMGDETQLLKVLDSINLEVKEQTGKIADQMLNVVKSTMGQMYLLLGKYRESSRMCNTVLNAPRTQIRQDLQDTCHLLNSINYLMLQDEELFESERRASLRYFESTNSTFHSEVIQSLHFENDFKGKKGLRESAGKIVEVVEKELALRGSDFDKLVILFWARSILSQKSATEEAGKWHRVALGS